MVTPEEAFPPQPRLPPRRRVRSFPPHSVVRQAVEAFHRGDHARCEALLGGLLARRSGGEVPVGRVPVVDALPRNLGAWDAPEEVAWALVEVAWVRFRQGEASAGETALRRCHDDLEALRARGA